MDEATGAEGPHDTGAELSEGIDHLQRAARELVAAARSFLDVVEQVVEDDERFSGAASSIADLVGRGFGSATGRDLAGGLLGGLTGREPTWLRNDPDHPDAPDEPEGPDDVDLFFGDASVDLADLEPQASAAVVPEAAAPATAAPATKAPATKAPAKKPPATPRTRRVTRISVD